MAAYLDAPLRRVVHSHVALSLTFINSVSRQRSGLQSAKWSMSSLCVAIGMRHRSLSVL
jgi:hypothetical protein